MGRRVQKSVFTNNGSGTFVPSYTWNYVYDGWNLVAVLDGNNNNSLVYSFAWGSDLSGSMDGAGGVGGLISMTVYSGVNAGTYFYCYDGNGNVIALVNAANGTIAAQYEYGPFGELLRATGPMAFVNPFRFSTKYQDDETGLLYYGYRYYNSSTGRWLSRDPIGERGGFNLYTCCGNSLVNETDPLGLSDDYQQEPIFSTGKVTVVKSQPIDKLFTSGWSISLAWTPPDDWKQKTVDCLPCKRAVWVQDRRYIIIYHWYGFSKDVDTGWGKDWDETDFSGSSVEWIAAAKGKNFSYWNATMDDSPSVSPTFRIKLASFEAHSKVKCEEGPDAGKIYADVDWFYFFWPNSVTSAVDGGVITIK